MQTASSTIKRHLFTVATDSRAPRPSATPTSGRPAVAKMKLKFIPSILTYQPTHSPTTDQPTKFYPDSPSMKPTRKPSLPKRTARPSVMKRPSMKPTRRPSVPKRTARPSVTKRPSKEPTTRKPSMPSTAMYQ
jgi:hypothetical protein